MCLRKRGHISINRQISKTTIFIALFIVVSASFMRQLMEFLKVHIGEKGFIVLIGLILIVCGLAFLVFTIRNNLSCLKTPAIILVLIVGLVLTWQMKIMEERIHILEYGLLGWFAGRDLIRTEKKIKGIILACIFSIFIGVFDEAFQAILPYRVFELRDIRFNSLGGIWGVILYLLGTAPYRDSSFIKIKE